MPRAGGEQPSVNGDCLSVEMQLALGVAFAIGFSLASATSLSDLCVAW